MPSIPKPLLALVRPDRAFAEWRPSLRVAAAVVLLVAVVNVAGLVVAADDVAGSVSGTVTIDNPDRPSETMCETFVDNPPFEDDPNITSGVAEDCRNEPEHVNASLSAAAREGADGQVPAGFLAPVVGWLLAAAAGLLLVGDGADGSYGEMLAAVAPGFIPAGVRYAARPVAVREALATWQQPAGGLDAVQDGAAALVAGAPTGWFAGLVAVTLAWQAVVLAYGVAAVAGDDGDAGDSGAADEPGTLGRKEAADSGGFGDDRPTDVGWPGVPTRALVVFGGVAALLVAASRSGFAGPVRAEVVGAAVVLGLFGLPNVAVPRTLIHIQKTFELIGFRGGEYVEPQDWYVWLTRAGGTVLLLVCFVLAGGLGYG